MGESTLSNVYNAVRKLNSLCATIAGLVLLFVTFSIFIDVFLRYFFNRPSIWVTEVSSYLFLYIIFLGTAYSLQQGLHIRVTFLLDRFGPAMVRIFNVITSLLAISFCVVLLWQTSTMAWSAYRESWTSPTMLSAPYVYIYVSMVFGSFLLLITFILRAILAFMGVEAKAQEK